MRVKGSASSGFARANSSLPHPIDVSVGCQLRQARKSRGLSQAALGEAIGISFQQVQKYERGYNRVSASKLAEAALFLEVPIQYFFAEIVQLLAGPTGALDPIVAALAADTRAMALLSAWRRLPPARRSMISDLITATARDGDEERLPPCI